MKTTTAFILISPLLGLLTGCESLGGKNAAALAAANAAKVEVELIAPENFTDVKDALIATAKGQAANAEQVRRYLVESSARHVPEGQHLKITVKDIDMAGDYEPWGRAQDIRLVKGIYPPVIELDFVLSDASGAVLKEGSRRLHDLAFQMRLDNRQNDPLRHEKGLIDDWLRSEFGPPQPSKKLALK
ncbi:hypothetical protein AXK11_01415 [Cephaloticoccus primus]|uniref:DUF3016 domain-containing protein n=1 Tax=Cephaloticoccus primus TaxID=1548207 RepID=A0A139STU9_9BACT|nr:DUF3016 domain-containing protein [Cephaloticoccus primus]KXU37985.1 hypothetical protein AXK11_01415 [Cephaloticoccus primus]